MMMKPLYNWNFGWGSKRTDTIPTSWMLTALRQHKRRNLVKSEVILWAVVEPSKTILLPLWWNRKIQSCTTGIWREKWQKHWESRRNPLIIRSPHWGNLVITQKKTGKRDGKLQRWDGSSNGLTTSVTISLALTYVDYSALLTIWHH